MDTSSPMLFTGNAHRALAEDIAHRLGIPLGKALVGKFSDGEVQIEIEENVRRQEVFVLQPTGAPSAENLFELLALVDALKRASAASVTAVIPYFGYARQDRRPRSARVPITAKLVARLVGTAGVDRVLTVDLHADQIQGFFNIPVDELTAVHILSNYFKHKHLDDAVVVTDLGFAKRARAFAELLDAPLAIIEKRRVGNLDRAELMNVIGEVRGKRAIIVDDEIDTAGTLIEIVRALEREGVTEIHACATHGVLSDPAIERIRDSNLSEVVLTDTVPLPPAKRIPKITTLSIAPLIGEAIKRIHRGESVGALFSSEVSFTQEMLLWEDGQQRTFDTRNEPDHGGEAGNAGAEDAEDDLAVKVASLTRPGDR